VNNAFQASAENLVGLSVIPLKDQRGLSDGQNEYKPLVSVSTKYLGDKIEISITDNGPGIPPHIKDKIFQPFFTTKPTGQGTGLGLSLAYDIIKAHGGEITVESKNGYGTEFIIKIPITL
jgi:signal transduction histidine kinase